MTDISQHRTAARSATSFPADELQVAELIRLVRDLRRSDGASLNRDAARFEIDAARAPVTVQHPGGSIAASEGLLVDLSAGGALLLYPGFLHLGTETVVHTETLSGGEAELVGRTVWCNFVSRRIHSIGVRWDEPIDVRRFIPSKQWLEQTSRSDDHSADELTGRMLLVGVDEVERELIGMFLASTSLELTAVESSGAGFDTIRQTAFDVMLIDADHPEWDAGELVRRIRADGFREPVVIASERGGGTDLDARLEGVIALPKPYSDDLLLGTIRDAILAFANPLSGTHPIRSELAGQPEKAQVISAYLRKLEQFAEVLRGSLSADNVPAATRAAQTIQNTAPGFGFPALGEAASQALSAIHASGSTEEAAPAIRLLIRVIGRLEAPGASRAA